MNKLQTLSLNEQPEQPKKSSKAKLKRIATKARLTRKSNQKKWDQAIELVAKEQPKKVRQLSRQLVTLEAVEKQRKADNERLVELENNFAEVSENVGMHAYQLYLRHTSIVDVSRITGMPLSEVKYNVYKEGGWKKVRDDMQAGIAEDVREYRKLQYSNAKTYALNIIEKVLKDQDKIAQEGLMEIDDALKVSKILTSLNAGDASEGKDDDPTDGKSVNPENMMDILVEDPYLPQVMEAKLRDKQHAQEDSDDESF